jgi:hypothetical protein
MSNQRSKSEQLQNKNTYSKYLRQTSFTNTLSVKVITRSWSEAFSKTVSGGCSTTKKKWTRPTFAGLKSKIQS